MERMGDDEINSIEASEGKNALDEIDPEAVAELDERSDSASGGPSSEQFEGFVSGVEPEPVQSDQNEDVPIDASMDDLFAE